MKAPPSLDETTELLAKSQQCLSLAWDNPEEIGPNTDILSEALLHYECLREFACPSGPTADDQFRLAISIAWQAVWRAKDYSTLGWARRWYSNQPDYFSSNLERLNAGAVEFEGSKWLPWFIPFFDKNGNSVENQPASVRWSLPAVLKNASDLEGFMIPSDAPESVFSRLGRFEWSFVSGKVIPKARYSHCLFERISSTDSRTGNQQQFEDCLVLGMARITNAQGFRIDHLATNHFLGGIEVSGRSMHGGLVPHDLSVNGYLRISAPVTNGLHMDSHVGIEKLDVSCSSVTGDVEILNTKRLSHLEIRFSDSSRPTNNLILRNLTCLEELRIETVAVHSDVILEGVLSSGWVRLKGLDIGQKLQILDCRFDDAVRIIQCEMKNVLLSGTKFNSDFDFLDSTASVYARFGHGNRSTFFGGVANFSVLSADKTASFRVSDFSRCEFSARADFSNREFKGRTRFDEVIFGQAPLFHGAELHQDTSFRGAEYNWVSQPEITFKPTSAIWVAGEKERLRRAFEFAYVKPSDRKKTSRRRNIFSKFLVRRKIELVMLWRRFFNPKLFARMSPELLRRNTLLGDTERAFRTLRQSMEDIRAQAQAAVFHQNELRARHLRSFDSSVSTAERLTGRLFDAFSNYGNSISLPLTYFLTLGVFMAAVYRCLASASVGFGTALATSYTVMFRPFFQLSPAYGRGAIDKGQVVKGNIDSTFELVVHLIAEHEIAFKLISLGHSLLSVILLFAVGLAIRRKFQLG